MTIHTANKLEKEAKLLAQLETMVSEGRNPDTLDIDVLDTQGVLTKINNEDKKVAHAVEAIIPEISQAVNAIVLAFKKGGRLIYMGAGTSGRLGILDAVECPPTFSVSDNVVVGLIAGGEGAIYKAVEGAEDNEGFGISDLKKANLTADDVVVGIAAGGRTPYVIGGLNYANELGCTTVSVTCNPGAIISQIADVALCAVVGPEALTGSTRMKSGTAQKLILNMLSTASMIHSGKIYQNLMVDVHASNEKLYARASKIVMQATSCNHQVAKSALEQANYNAKLAILMILTGKDIKAAKQLLNSSDGFLRQAIS